jgi:putative FmdB family regulatory protein
VPLYEYECLECKARFEKLIYNKETEVVCASCGSPKINQLLSVFAVGGSPQGASAPEASPCGNCSAAQRGMCGMQ